MKTTLITLSLLTIGTFSNAGTDREKHENIILRERFPIQKCINTQSVTPEALREVFKHLPVSEVTRQLQVKLSMAIGKNVVESTFDLFLGQTIKDLTCDMRKASKEGQACGQDMRSLLYRALNKNPKYLRSLSELLKEAIEKETGANVEDNQQSFLSFEFIKAMFKVPTIDDGLRPEDNLATIYVNDKVEAK